MGSIPGRGARRADRRPRRATRLGLHPDLRHRGDVPDHGARAGRSAAGPAGGPLAMSITQEAPRLPPATGRDGAFERLCPGGFRSSRRLGRRLPPGHHAADRQRLFPHRDFRHHPDSRHRRAEPDVPGRLWRHGQPDATDDRGPCRLHDGGARRQRQRQYQPRMAVVACNAHGARSGDAVRHHRRRARGTHRGHLHHHDHAGDRRRRSTTSPTRTGSSSTATPASTASSRRISGASIGARISRSIM